MAGSWGESLGRAMTWGDLVQLGNSFIPAGVQEDRVIDACVNVRIMPLVVDLAELSQRLRGYYQMVFGGEVAVDEPTGKAVIDVLVIGIASKPFLDAYGSVGANLSAVSASAAVTVGGLSAKDPSNTGLVPDHYIEWTYEV